MKVLETASETDYSNLFITYLPILTLISLGIGIVKELVYYYFFHLDILNYIDVNEILLGTVTNLIKCILIILATQVFIEIFIFLRIRILKISDYNKSNSAITLTLKSANIITIIILVIYALIFILFYNKFNTEKIVSVNQEWQFFLETYFTMGLLLIFSVIYFPLIYQTNYSKSINSRYIKIVIAGITILSWTINFSVKEATETKLLSTFGTYIEIGGKKIMSDQNYYYIGRTKSFVFFYDTKEDYTDVYQSKDITLLALNNKGFIKTTNELIKDIKQKDSIIKARILDSVNHKK
jgi:hypothetical protein